MELTKAQLKALHYMLMIACDYITAEDEPLLDEVYEIIETEALRNV